jgi:hypothetical protein
MTLRDDKDPPGKGWFAVEGRQVGDRTLTEQMMGLGPLIGEAAGRSVLDLGCAEGLIALEMLKAGAARAHGAEAVPSRVATACDLCAGRPAVFFVADLESFAAAPPDWLLPAYDIVLLLSIAHKFRDPEAFLRAAADRAAEFVAVRLPAPILVDWRSGFRPVDVPAVMASEGFRLWHEAPGPRAEWVGIFRRG